MTEAADAAPGDSSRSRHVRIVSLPFTSLQHPALGASLLATALRHRQIRCEIDYFAFDFAETIGVETYLILSNERIYQAFLGEWIFSDLVYPRPEARDMEYLTHFLTRHAGAFEGLQLILMAMAARKAARGFIDDCARRVAEAAPDLVGVTTSFQQNLASIAFAKALRARAPDIPIIFGGANCEAELGRHLLGQVPEIDAVCTGEGDVAFPAYAAAVLEGGATAGIPGIAMRGADRVRPSGLARMDALPVPCFDDFFERFARVPGLSDVLTPVPTIETSRGCWWGAKHHCTFCGLNGETMAYRSKPADRAMDEFRLQADRYGADFVAVDNILDHGYFDSLLPALRDDPRRFTIHFEVKANLSARHVRGLAEAGIRKVQPGLETLDSGILRLMKKGVSAIQNIQTLRLCAEAGVYVDWGFIFGFPGEDPAAYDRMAGLIPLLHHLQPPAAFAPVRADRFSPYFTRPGEYGILAVPAAPYAYIYAGLPEPVLQGFAYHHDIVGAGVEHAGEYTDGARRAVEAWRASAGLFHVAEEVRGCITLLDSRRGPEIRLDLDAGESAILRLCDMITTRQKIAGAETGLSGARMDKLVEGLLARGILIAEREMLLALPLCANGPRRAPSWAEIRAMMAQPPDETDQAAGRELNAM